MMFRRNLVCSIGLVLATVLSGGHADAAMVPLSDNLLITGTQLDVIELEIDRSGTYEVTVTDLEWFSTPLSALSFGVFTSTAAIETHTGSGTLAFFQNGPGSVFLQVFAQAGGARGYGLVNVQAEMVVALPSSIVLLGSVLGLWFPLSRRRVNRPSIDASLQHA